jgi:hypothetical protein
MEVLKMSIVQTLTEGIVQRDMAKEGQALLNKWSQTGLLEGITDDRQRSSMARLLENQAKELLRESSSMQAGDVEGFAAVAFPIVRRVFAGLIANDLVSVQPMSLPSGLIFFLDFTFSGDLGETAGAINGRMGNLAGASVYGTNRVGSEITGGVSLVDTYKGNLSGPRNMVGYAYASPTGSLTDVTFTLQASGTLNVASEPGRVSDWKTYLKFDADILSLSGTADSYAWAAYTVDIGSSGGEIDGDLDLDNISAITASIGELTGVEAAGANLIRRLTAVVDDDTLRFVVFGASGSNGTAGVDPREVATTNNVDVVYPKIDTLEDAGALGSIRGGTEWGLEGEAAIPEIDIKVDSIAITAQTKKLKAKWTPELGQDLNAYHNLDAEVELTSILSEQIALEIDREILADLVNGATAGTFYWSRSPGLFVNRETGLEIGASAAAPDFTGTVSEWYETLIETINDVSAQIHRKTLRGGANFVVCGPEVANILEFTAGFRANVTADADKGDIGAVKVGSLSRKFDVIVDPYFPRNALLVGRRGASFLESGYVYAPYVPLQTTPTIFGPEDFVPRKGVMTRYAKKMVRPDMYGLVIVRGLLGESGA